MNYYDESYNKAADFLNTDLEKGLNNTEAENRLKKYGPNIIKEKKKDGLLKKFIAQFNDFMVITLLIAAAVSYIVSVINHENDFIDPIIILVIITANSIMGVVQESRAEKSIEALKKMTVPIAKIIRDGVIKNISSENIVPGDIIIIETGDYIAADARLISSVNLKVDEAMLTGESLAIEKNADVILKSNALLGDRINMIYCGSFVSSGRGKAIVTSTSMDTQVGKIADMIMTEQDNDTPLQKRLDDTGKTLGIATLVICTVIFAMGLVRKIAVFEMFMTSVSLAVAAIPEGLPAIVTIVLAIGVRRMAKQNAIVKKLPAVETLGCANIICSDKTGTLTQNKMHVVESKNYLDDKDNLIKYACLCNNSTLKIINNNFETIGDSTETALVLEAIKNNINKNDLEEKYKRVGEVPFDSQRKLMTTIHKNKSSQDYLIITKGAPDILLSHCKYYKNAKTELDFNTQKKISEDNKNMAQKALRVIAVAFKIQKKFPDHDLENNLIFAGLIGMIDPPRDEVFEAVHKCKLAGIKPVMITGDHILTAEAIAKKIGIMSPKDKSLSGSELEKISDQDLSKNIFDYSVFARVSPEHKVKIVKAFQDNNSIVAMTGDGVNDAPALKIADIGCAMGKSGTDVAKSAADMILTDDNFKTIVEAVREGRSIYANIGKAVHFLISTNIGEIIAIFMAIFFGWKSPLLAIHLLWVNLVTDSLPAIALGLELPEENIMQKKPVNNNQGLFDQELWQRILIEGAMIGLISLISYGLGNIYYDLEVARTMAFCTMSISQLVHVFNIKDERSVFKINLFNNIYVILAFALCCFLQASVVMIKPLSIIFHVAQLDFNQWAIVLCLSCLPIIIVEIEKYLLSKQNN